MEQPTVVRAALAGLVAGLAVSSKYNAAPVVPRSRAGCVSVRALVSGHSGGGARPAGRRIRSGNALCPDQSARPPRRDGVRSSPLRHSRSRRLDRRAGMATCSQVSPVDVRTGERHRDHGRRPHRRPAASALAPARGTSDPGLPRRVRPLHAKSASCVLPATCSCCCRSLPSRQPG